MLKLVREVSPRRRRRGKLPVYLGFMKVPPSGECFDERVVDVRDPTDFVSLYKVLHRIPRHVRLPVVAEQVYQNANGGNL